MRGSMRILTGLSVALLLSACATPARLRGEYVDLDPINASTGKFSGTPVRWGGIITGARATDADTCVEVAVFPLDRWTLRPRGLPDGYYHATDLKFMYRRSPSRFLACGNEIRDRSEFYSGGVVTVTGHLETPLSIEAALASCEGDVRRQNLPDYAGTVHLVSDGICAVSLPVLKISQIHVWKQQPSSYGIPDSRLQAPPQS